VGFIVGRLALAALVGFVGRRATPGLVDAAWPSFRDASSAI